MQDFKDKVAVITGAASGIGFGIAERCAQEGMKVVLSGINMDNLVKAQAALKETGAELLCVQADVSKLEDIERLAQTTLDAFGQVHLLVNNAGVGAGGTIWESSLEDWEWVVNVNLWGVIYGIKVFIPIMLAQDNECHVVNTSSIAGLLASYPSAPYHVTKQAEVALSENLYYSLRERNAKIRVSVLCPGWVKTKILDSGRNRPGGSTLDDDPTWERLRKEVESGMTVQEIAEHVFQGIREKKLYILTHKDWHRYLEKRFDRILSS